MVFAFYFFHYIVLFLLLFLAPCLANQKKILQFKKKKSFGFKIPDVTFVDLSVFSSYSDR